MKSRFWQTSHLPNRVEVDKDEKYIVFTEMFLLSVLGKCYLTGGEQGQIECIDWRRSSIASMSVVFGFHT
jgi:hypothetical protein